MGKTKIEWADYTFNPWIGCRKVSDGCRNCYAERDFKRKPQWANCWGNPKTTERKRTSKANWRKPLSWNREAEAHGKQYRVFCASLADVFEDADGLGTIRADLYDMMSKTENLTWLLLTKRPDNMRRMTHDGLFLPNNVWVGTTVENHDNLWRIEELLEIPATVHFVSVEPMLGRVDIDRHLLGACNCHDSGRDDHAVIDWVICGGESGPGARPTDVDWVRSLRDQCVESNTPFLFKQWGEHDQRGRKVGRKAAGRLVDGREWLQFPE